MRVRCAVVVWLAVRLFAGASAASAAEAPVAQTSRVVFYTWWVSASERAALRALVDLFNVKYPGVPVVTPVVPGNGGPRNLFPIVKGLVAANHAPEAFQMHAGYGAQPFFDAGLLSPIDALWESEGLEKVIPARIQDLCRVEHHYYSIPIGVHRMNVIWYNKPLLDQNGIDPDSLRTWDALFKAADTLRAKGVPSPIQLGQGWTGRLVFQGIVAGEGIETYQQWVNGRLQSPDDPRMLVAFGTFRRYLAYVNPDHAQLGWDAALKRVIDGEGAFYVMGDWANGEFRQAGKKYGKDYGSMPMPGTRSMYAVTIDTFLRPREVASAINSNRWFQVGASREGQDAFNALKGSISPRSDADTSRYDVYQKSAIADLKSAKYIYPSLDSAVPDVFQAALDGILANFDVDRDVRKAAAAQAGASGRLTRKFIRSWSLL